ncbi:MAG: hypothetical protein J5533_06320, partial [Bacteroidales bacterium]|nr:hypothetical protein [Bacteroidales bacterium]
MRTIVTTIAAALLLISCTAAEPFAGKGPGSANVRFTVGPLTRSSVAAAEDAIGSLALYFYLDGV